MFKTFTPTIQTLLSTTFLTAEPKHSDGEHDQTNPPPVDDGRPSAPYVVFLCHRQKDIDPQYGIRMQDLAARMYENLKGRGRLSFLDKNYNGNSWGDLPNIVARSKTIVVLLSEKFVESPWCVLELLSAIMHQRPIAFFRISDTFKLAALTKQLIDIGFPFVKALDKFSVEIDYCEHYFESVMDKIVERVKINEEAYPLSVDVVVTRDKVVEQYKLLRDARNEKFPNKRSWPSWGADFDEKSEYKDETKIEQQSVEDAPASFTKRISNEKKTISVESKYMAVCRQCWNRDIK